jgi:hypothetical protein
MKNALIHREMEYRPEGGAPFKFEVGIEIETGDWYISERFFRRFQTVGFQFPSVPIARYPGPDNQWLLHAHQMTEHDPCIRKSVDQFIRMMDNNFRKWQQQN